MAPSFEYLAHVVWNMMLDLEKSDWRERFVLICIKVIFETLEIDHIFEAVYSQKSKQLGVRLGRV